MLLLLFAIPADDCSAQTPPPSVDRHAFERAPPTVETRLATRFSLGAFAGRFEETPLVFDGKLHSGMSRLELVVALGPPSTSEADQMVNLYEAKLADGFEETAWLILGFREEKLVSMRGGKTTTN